MKKLPVKPLPKVMHDSLSAPALLNQVRKNFEKIPDPRRYGQQFSLADVLMSGLAIFNLKYPSLLKFDEQRTEARIRANLQSLFGVKQAPCDTQLRAVCDQVDPAKIQAPFIHINQQLYNQGLLEDFRYLGGFYSVLMERDNWPHRLLAVPNVVSVVIGMVKRVIIINC